MISIVTNLSGIKWFWKRVEWWLFGVGLNRWSLWINIHPNRIRQILERVDPS